MREGKRQGGSFGFLRRFTTNVKAFFYDKRKAQKCFVPESIFALCLCSADVKTDRLVGCLPDFNLTVVWSFRMNDFFYFDMKLQYRVTSDTS